MSAATDLLTAKAALIADVATMDAIVNGPASGTASLVTLPSGGQVKTLARIAAEAAALTQQATIFETVKPVTITSGALPVDLTLAGIFTATLSANVTSLSISGAVAGAAMTFLLELTGDGTQRTFSATGLTEMNGVYVPTPTSGKKDRLLYETLDGGTTWRRWIVQQAY